MFSAILIFLNIILIFGKRYKSATGVTFIISSLYVYFGLIQLTNNNYEFLFRTIIITHFILALLAPQIRNRSSKNIVGVNRLFTISTILILIYIVILISFFDPYNLELSRMTTFARFKPLYYNLLIIWPILFLLKQKVNRYHILFYLIACFLTGFRSLLVNFVFLMFLKEMYSFSNKNFRRIITVGVLLMTGIVLLSMYRTTNLEQNITQSLLNRVFIINSENIEDIISLNPLYGGEIILRDFVPIRYILNPFHQLDLTSAEHMTKILNAQYFYSGRIMTPTMIGLGIAAWGKFGAFVPIICVFILDYCLFVAVNKINKSLWLVWLFISISFATRGVLSVLGLYGSIASVIIFIALINIEYGKRYNHKLS